ncbi:hypothetical protein LguiB_004225 [Lonicera macranthoides]
MNSIRGIESTRSRCNSGTLSTSLRLPQKPFYFHCISSTAQILHPHNSRKQNQALSTETLRKISPILPPREAV